MKHTNDRDAAERQFVREAAKQNEQHRLDHAVNAALLEWIAAASQSALLVRLELTFKRRVMTALGKRTHQPRQLRVRYTRVPSAVVPTWKAIVDDSRVQNVKMKPSRRGATSPSAPPSIAAHYLNLPTNEPARVAVTLINALNRHFFKGRSRRATNPERLTALMCVHDRDELGKRCRPHVHALIALPPNVTVAAFTGVVRRAVEDELFVHRRLLVEPVVDIAGSVFYNANPDKHSDRAPVVLIHPECPLPAEKP